MRTAILYTSTAIAMALLGASPLALAATSEHMGGGLSCRPAPDDFDSFYFDWRGAGNRTSTAAVAQCRTELPYHANQVLRATVYYTDNSAVAPFLCSIFATASDGSQTWSASKWTCGASWPDGCPSDINTDYHHVRTGVLRWTSALPLSSAYYVQAGASCNVPPTHNGAISWVRGVYAQYHSNP